MRLRPLPLLVSCALGLAGCEEEKLTTAKVCTQNDAGYDVSSQSRLDVVHTMRLAHIHPAMKAQYGSYVGGIDAVEIDSTRDSSVDGVWTVNSVDVLVAIPADEFNGYLKNAELAALVYDSTNPGSAKPYVVKQTLDPSQLTWEDTSLQLWDKDDPDVKTGVAMKTAWWTFDFSKVIPADKGVTASTYLVGVQWFSDEHPLVGASARELDCGKNWYDFGDGELRHGIDRKMTCTWPYLKVHTQYILSEKTTCE